MRRATIKFNREKFAELILYIAAKCETDIYFGATKLNKVLFFSDFLAHQKLGQPITGARYQALEWGPAPVELRPIRDQMEKRREIGIRRRDRQERIYPLRDADLDKFHAREIAIVDKVIEELRDKDADSVSELSHLFLGYAAAWAKSLSKGGRVIIPYGTVFVSKPRLNEFETTRILERARKEDWPVKPNQPQPPRRTAQL